MKYLKTLLVLILFGTAFVACEKDEVSYAFQEISAPTNVTANFEVTQDDTGLVTVTPSGEGAESFKVYWGESANEEPEVVTPGGSLDHTYVEGEFKVRVVGVGSTNLTSEYQQMLTISFTAPEDLKVTIDQSSPNPKLIKVSATAVNASSFDVYFGDVEDEEPTQLMPDETIEHTYEATGDYTVKVVAKGAGVATLEYTEEITIAEASGAIALPITFDDPAVNYEGFIEGAFSVVDNPAPGGANDVESKVGAIENAGDEFEAILINLGTPVDFSEKKVITMKLWSTTPFPVVMKFEGGVDGERENEIELLHGGTGWEDLSFDYANDARKSYIDGNQGAGEPFVPTGKYAKIAIFVDFAGTTAGTFYIDDIEQPGADLDCALEMEENVDPAQGDINWTFKSTESVQENPAYFEPFGSIDAVIVPNPDPSGINESCNVESYVKFEGCETWSGVGKELATPIDMSTATNKAFKMMVYGETKATKVTLQLEFLPFPDTAPLVAIDQEMTKVGEWEELTFDFSEHTDKTFKSVIVYFDRDQACDDAVYYFDNLKQVAGDDNGGGPIGGTGPTSLPIDFETAETGADSKWEVFEDTTPPLEVIANPDMFGDNTSATVAKFTAPLGGVNYAGTVTKLSQTFTLDASNSKVSIMVWKSVISDVGIKFESDKASTGEIKIANTKINEWEEIIFDFSGKIGEPSSTNIDAIVIFPDFDDRTQENIVYFDNITLSGDGGGSEEPKTAAPSPEQSQSDVKSLFSDVYTDETVDTWRTEWSDAVLEDVTIDGSAMKKYSALNFVGIETVSSPIDASEMTHFRTDVWSADFTTFKMKLVDFGADGMFGGGDDVEHEITIESPAQGEWVSLDIPLTEFTGLTTRGHIAQLIYVGAPSGGNTVFIDNVYFYKENDGGGSEEPKTAAPSPEQSQSDVKSLFSDVYTDETVDTWRTEWSDAVLEDVTIDGSAMKKYSALNFVGIETVSSPIDASEMTHFRTDVWSADFTTFKMKLVDFGADGMFGGGDDVEHEITIESPAQGEWVSLDIPLTEFTGLTTRGHIAQLIYVGAPSGGNTVFIDNVYFYKENDGGGNLTEPATAAPAPGVDAAKVISLFSDAYEDVVVDTWRTEWSDAVLEDVTIDGSAMKKYSALNFVGIETVSSTIDATDMTQFHLDVWSADFTTLKVKLVDFGADGMFGGGDDVEHEITIESPAQGNWVGLELDLADFTGLTTRAHIAQLILVGAPTANNTVFVDNVYFHN